MIETPPSSPESALESAWRLDLDEFIGHVAPRDIPGLHLSPCVFDDSTVSTSLHPNQYDSFVRMDKGLFE